VLALWNKRTFFSFPDFSHHCVQAAAKTCCYCNLAGSLGTLCCTTYLIIKLSGPHLSTQRIRVTNREAFSHFESGAWSEFGNWNQIWMAGKHRSKFYSPCYCIILRWAKASIPFRRLKAAVTWLIQLSDIRIVCDSFEAPLSVNSSMCGTRGFSNIDSGASTVCRKSKDRNEY
jgi:hypothetical protein